MPWEDSSPRGAAVMIASISTFLFSTADSAKPGSRSRLERKDAVGSGWHPSRMRTTGNQRTGDLPKDTGTPLLPNRSSCELHFLKGFKAELAGCPQLRINRHQAVSVVTDVAMYTTGSHTPEQFHPGSPSRWQICPDSGKDG